MAHGLTAFFAFFAKFYLRSAHLVAVCHRPGPWLYAAPRIDYTPRFAQRLYMCDGGRVCRLLLA